jgi:hypothetical protein
MTDKLNAKTLRLELGTVQYLVKTDIPSLMAGIYEALADVPEGDEVTMEDRFLIDIGNTLKSAAAQLSAFRALYKERKPLFDPFPDMRPIEFAYLALLKLSPTDKFRRLNQNIYASLRDAIAEASGDTPGGVQVMFEQFAAQEKQKKTQIEVSQS